MACPDPRDKIHLIRSTKSDVFELWNNLKGGSSNNSDSYSRSTRNKAEFDVSWRLLGNQFVGSVALARFVEMT